MVYSITRCSIVQKVRASFALLRSECFSIPSDGWSRGTGREVFSDRVGPGAERPGPGRAAFYWK